MPILVLAQTRSHPIGEVMIWLGVLLVAAVLIGVIGYMLRKRLLGGDDGEETIQPFTLADLRRLHREGQLSDEEYERAKAAMIAQTRSAFGDQASDENDDSVS